MKEKIKKEYLRRTRKILETKLCGGKLIQGIITCIRRKIFGTILEVEMDQRTRKLMIMHKALHPRDDVDRLYLSRKEGGKGLTNIKGSVNASIQGLEDYIEKRGEGLITATRNDTDNTKTNRTTITRKQK